MDLTERRWKLWSTDAHLVVTDPGGIEEAHRLVLGICSAVEGACSRFLPSSELRRAEARIEQGVSVSPLLGSLLRTALEAAARTGGAVDPTLGDRISDLGYDTDLSVVQRRAHLPVQVQLVGPRGRTPHWRRTTITGDVVTAPAGTRFDLGATAKAFAADRAAGVVAATLGCGVLVSLGGDIATAGPAPDGGWQVTVDDGGVDRRPQQITLEAGWALATSSTQHRRWRVSGEMRHHILDPRTLVPATARWAAASVAAPTCVEANTWSTAAVVWAEDAIRLLEPSGRAARLLDLDGRVHRLGGWPADGPAVTVSEQTRRTA